MLACLRNFQPPTRHALTDLDYQDATDKLLSGDPELAEIVQACGMPEIWWREPGFATLVYIIFEQQVSLASARATFIKVRDEAGEITPQAFLMLNDEALRAAGVSRQKARYTRLLAEAIVAGNFSIDALGSMSDDDARRALLSLTGVGNWTADVYLMLALKRGDCWPIGDLALQKALAEIKGFDWPIAKEVLQALGERYKPNRSLATRIFWQHYLSKAS